MPKRQTKFLLGGMYHIYNRGVNRNAIFISRADYKCFERMIDFYRFKSNFSYTAWKRSKYKFKLNRSVTNQYVEIYAYCALQNHFHLQVVQKKLDGVTIFMSRLLNSYSHYFNLKYRRVGPLFQNRFQDVPVTSDQYMLYLSAYIHRNPMEAGLTDSIESLIAYPYSSLSTYVAGKRMSFIEKKKILSFFKNRKDYLEFVTHSRSGSKPSF